MNFLVENIVSTVWGPLPSTRQLDMITYLRRNITAAYDEIADELLLRTLFQLGGLSGEFIRTGTEWKKLGFQREDPISDVRGGGKLSLENLLFFLKHYKATATAMHQKRSDRSQLGQNYPWAAVGINITRMLAVFFEVITVNGLSAGIKHTHKSYWHFLDNENDFSRLYACAFVVLDRNFDELNATYQEFPNVLAKTNADMLQLLYDSENIQVMENKLNIQFEA